MGTRADQTHSNSPDGDTTDELPALDVAAYEAAHGLASDAHADTDVWPAPGSSAASAEPAIFDTIRSLEANLRAKSERSADLEQLLARAERDRETAERRLREREQGLARLERELEGRTAALSRAEQHAQEAAEAQRNAERQVRAIEKDKADLLSRIADLEEARLGLAADVEARGTTIARFKVDLAARAEQIRTLEQQRDNLESEKIAVADTLRARDTQVESLDAEVAARNASIADAQRLVAARDEGIAHLQQQLDQARAETRATEQRVAERETKIAAFEKELQDKEDARLEMARDLKNHVRRTALAEEAMRVSERQAESCVEALQSLEGRRNFYDDELFVREQEIERQLGRISALEA